MKAIYTLLFHLALPLILLRLLWRGIKAPAYFHRWPERFGKVAAMPASQPIIWVHAVSVGEVEATRPLISGLRASYPEHRILITTMTPTGSERVKKLYTGEVDHCYLPYDLPFAIRRFLKAKHPEFGIIMETELWPNLVDQCHQHHIPLVLANARLSARSAKGYQRFSKLTAQMLKQFCFIAAQTQEDQQRFRALGAEYADVHATGNLKFEISLPASATEQAEAIRSMWGNRPVWIAASTHEGEEELVLNASRKVRAEFPDLLLLLVPRHPERFDRAAALSRKAGFKTLRRSEGKPCGRDIEVLVIDTMGELPTFYATCDVALIGGSLIPHGGHNLLEPAALGRPVLTGPHFFNFNEITKQFLDSGAAMLVRDSHEIAQTMITLLSNAEQRASMGQTAIAQIQRNQGASMRLLNLIKRHIKQA
ncbi:lipid IV(A) 3-deoxy-D-manno-octulosonic acid transferase [Methylophaga lonarensis]|uniref:lipid IV(A) 3-deoxy-D-manno-octulosonic acid transferase n=1 Tax=Methylophaga lonarensis TaxID=999151 RepID=UPI003D2B29E0